MIGRMSSGEEVPQLCLCGCGEPVAAGAQWKRGHWSCGEGGGARHLTPLPPSAAGASGDGLSDDELADLEEMLPGPGDAGPAADPGGRVDAGPASEPEPTAPD